MTASVPTVRGALWAQPRDVEEQTLPLWRAALIAFGIEVVVPFLVFGVNWSWLPSFNEPPPIPVMSVRLEPPPPPPPPEKKKEKPKPKKIKKLRNLPIELPKPMPGEVASKIELPQIEPEPRPEPKKEPEPEPEPKKEEEKKPEPEPEAPPLPSVFRDIKPVKKVKPKYPREAEEKRIQGRVRVRMTVDVEGDVSDVKILLAEPAGMFEESVVEAVRQFQFKRDGTSYDAEQEFIFKIDD